jgi:GNAT superfamily N-acetyltransferase
MIGPLSGDQRDRLAGALNEVEALLGVEPVAPPVLRAHRTGDMGWVMERHAVLYNREYGWGPLMEAHVAEIVGHFLKTFDPEREHCWIAEQGGARLGSAFVVNDGDGIARIRLVLLEPAARGWGLGRRLVEACIAFARERGYRGMVLWTHQKLTAARAIYASVGFELVDSEIHHDFGVPEVGETWRLAF